MDESAIEQAELHQEFLKQKAIERQRAQVPKGIGPEECECGNPIPLKRRELGYHTCIACAEHKDRRDAQHRR
jgi:RNA polymerase-binding transcription factor DksA